ncbi:hypothetical protein OH77DRAFT_1426270 [Trametes cingulata]|nr:hypothetical protein OH77DRAFT_1426270 [Trametes cingulata]
MSFTAATLVLLCLIVTSCSASLVNRTIDDQKGDSVTGAVPLFAPPDTWHIGQTCAGCAVRAPTIDPGQVFEGTWHDSTFRGLGQPAQDIEIHFQGSAIYAFHIIINGPVPSAKTLTNLTFYLDGNLDGTYEHEPDGTGPLFLYNVSVYGNSNIPYGDHVLQIVSTGVDPALVLFDYAVYTTEDDGESSSVPVTSPPASNSPSPSSPSHLLPTATSSRQTLGASTKQPATAAIVGGAVGGAVALVLAVLALFFWRRSARQKRERPSSYNDASTAQGDSTQSLEPGEATAATPFIQLTQGPPISSRKLAQWNDDPSHTSFGLSSAPQTPAVPPSEFTHSTQATRSTQLMQEIQELQRQVNELRAARNAGGAVSSDGSAQEQVLTSSLVALREEMSALRAELGEQQHYQSPPSYEASG